jgi:aldose 1-epimerase
MPDRYAVTQERGQYRLVDDQSRARAAILPETGNNVTHFRVQPAGRDVPIDVILPPSGPEGLGPNGYSAGVPILFPFPNRVRGGEYTFQGRAYELDINETARGNHIHGLVSKLPWQVEGTGAGDAEGAWHRAVIDLSQFPEAMRQYPFSCLLRVITRLKDGTLIQETTVTNTGQTPLPMGYGIHPWFPATIDGGPREETEVTIPADGYWELQDLVPTGRVLPADQQAKFDLRHSRALDEEEYDDVFTGVIRRADGWIAASIRYPNVGYQIDVEASSEFREWVLFAPRTRRVICIEPYTGTTNAVNLQNQGVDAGLVVLEPGDSWMGEIRISLQQEA